MRGEKAECGFCGKEFIKRMRTQVNCSTDCSDKKSAYKAKHKEIVNRFAIFHRDNFKCIYCGKSSIEHQARLVLDHLHPQILGGGNEPSNLVTACTECNTAKGGKVLSAEVIARINTKINQ